MASPVGGQFLFDIPSGASKVNLGLTATGANAPFPGTVAGALNIEVFTSVSGGTLPALATGFTAGAIASDTVAGDAAPNLLNGFLTGRALQLFTGDYRVTDSVTGSTLQRPAQITAGSGNQTLVGAQSDTLIGGSGATQLLDASKGQQTVTQGTGGNFTVTGGVGDSILSNATATSASGGQIAGALGGMSIALNAAGNYTVSSGSGDTITGNGSAANAAITGAKGDLINLAGSTGSNTVTGATGGDSIFAGTGNNLVIGGTGDTITGGSGGTLGVIDAAGKMSIVIGTSGSVVIGQGGLSGAGGDTITSLPNSTANVAITGAATDNINLTGNSGADTITGAANDTIVAGSGNATIIGATGDSITGGSAGNRQINAGAGKMTIVVGSGGGDTVSSGGGNTITALPNGNGVVSITAGTADTINLTGNTGTEGITGATGAKITVGGGNSAVNGASGGVTVTLAATGSDTLTGSTVAGSGDSISGSGGSNFIYNPGATGLSVTGGDLINLSGSTGNATINAFNNGATLPSAVVDFASVNDTILAGNGADSVWGGPNDRIGIGTGTSVGGTHLWDHSTTVAGASVLYGTNDSIAGSSKAQVTVTNFSTANDGIFYQNESAATTSGIVASAKPSIVGGQASTVITLPDGTTMTLLGVATVTAAMFKP